MLNNKKGHNKQLNIKCHSDLIKKLDGAIKSFVNSFHSLHISKLARQVNLILQLTMEASKEFPDRIKPILKKLGEHGWFVSWEMPASTAHEFDRVFNQKRIDIINDYMIEFYLSRMQSLKNELKGRHPKGII